MDINEPNMIYNSLSDLSVSEIDKMMNRLIAERKTRFSTVLSDKETDLLNKINKTLPNDIQLRYNKLIDKKNTDSLSEKELNELLGLTSYIENFNNERLKYLIELSKIRNISLDELLEQLQIKPKYYVSE